MATDLTLEERIVQVLRLLRITQAHMAASMAPDWRGLAVTHASLFPSLALVCPTALDPNDLSALSCPLLLFTGDQGPRPERLRRSAATFRNAAVIQFPNYLGETWSDVIADRTTEVGVPHAGVPPTRRPAERKHSAVAS